MDPESSNNSNESEILYLGMYDSSSVMKMICDFDPVLLYFVCFRGGLVKTSPLFDHQEDCKILNKMGIVKYLSPKERTSHFVKESDCELSKNTKQLVEDIEHIGLHKILQKIGSKSKTREGFRVVFFNQISFDNNPNNILEDLIALVNAIHDVGWNIHESKGEKNGVEWFVVFTTPDAKELHYSVNLKCKCKSKMNENYIFNSEEFVPWEPYSFICEKCKREYQISANFRYIYIIEKQ